MIVLDTHIFLWYVLGDQRLPEPAAKRLLREYESVFVPSICFWEILMLCDKGKVHLGTRQPGRVLREIFEGSQFREVPLTKEIAMLSRTLEFVHDDPADRFIGATAYALKAQLATADESLRTLAWVRPAF